MTTMKPDQADDDHMVDMGERGLMLDPYGGYSRIRERAPLVRAVMPGVEPGIHAVTPRQLEKQWNGSPGQARR